MRDVDDRARRVPPLTLTIPQAADLLGISVSKAYEAARAGDLPTVKIGARVLVSRRRLQELIDGPRAALQGRVDYDRAGDGRTHGLDPDEHEDGRDYWRR